MTDRSQRAHAFKRAVDLATGGMQAELLGLIEQAEVSSVTSGDGALPRATLADGEELPLLEPYGFASRPLGTAYTLALAPGGDYSNCVGLGLADASGRPAMDPGDAAFYTAAGHKLFFDNDGGLTLESKDGAVIELPVSGAVNLTAGPASSVNVTVDVGASVNVGGPGALELLQAQPFANALLAALAFATLPGNFLVQDGGVKLLQSFVAHLTGTPPSVPATSITQTAATKKAKGE